MEIKCTNWRTLASLAGLVVLIAACSDTSSLNTRVHENDDFVSGEFSLSVPESIMSLRALNLDALYAEIVINGDSETVSQGTAITKTFSVANGGNLAVSVAWFESQGNEAPLALSSWSDDFVVSGGMSINVGSTDHPYVSTGAAFNVDGDDYSNLAERQAGSDPLLASSTPENLPDVRIRWVSPSEAPVIDGQYDQIWNSATFNDVDGERLNIDNLMINQGAIRPNGSTEFRWFALHDDINLYVFVFGKNLDASEPIRDSTGVWNDDNVNLFIDGNNSKLTSYDGFDDRHLFVPLLTDPSNPTVNSTVVVNGGTSAPLPAFDFATCLCSGLYTWEFKLPFAEFNIQKDVPFGFEVQLDVDEDGDARDARWGWFHPARTTEDVDNTWTNPSFMGTVVVE